MYLPCLPVRGENDCAHGIERLVLYGAREPIAAACSDGHTSRLLFGHGLVKVVGRLSGMGAVPLSGLDLACMLPLS